MKTPAFTSVFAPALRQFVAFKRAAAYAYEHGARDLASFDRFAAGQPLSQPWLTGALADQYRAHLASVSSKVRYDRLCVLRDFSAFHHLDCPPSEVLRELGVRKTEPRRWVVLAEHEVAALMQACGGLDQPAGAARSLACLLGLLYCCGLRVGEALALNVADFDPRDGTLFVRRGKFGKQRHLALAPSAGQALRLFLPSCPAATRRAGQGPLFADRRGRRLTHSRVYHAFNRLLDGGGLRARYGRVRLHDLRHSFASTVLRRTVAAEGDLYAVLPKLATFMGHVSFRSTQRYLHTDAGCLVRARDRFHDAFYTPAQTHTPGATR